MKNEDLKKIDILLPQYFKEEYGIRADWMQWKKESFSDQIREELPTFQQELPRIYLEMQIILNFVDEKRTLIKELLSILKSNETDELVQEKNFHGIVTDD